MKKYFQIFFTFSFLFILFFFPKKTTADSWIKYENNPVISSGNGWETNDSAPSIILENNKLKMWYQANEKNKWVISYAESTDGINWTRNSNSPVLVPQNETGITETDTVEPCVIKKDGVYHMWFNSQNGTAYKIRYAISNDGLSWIKYPNYVLVGESSWELSGVANPHVIYKDGKYLMWYMGWGSNGWKVGFAQSDDGIIWKKHENNPLSLPNSGHVGGQFVSFEHGYFQMFYHTGGSVAKEIYRVISTDGINWSCEGECLVLANSTDNFDSDIVNFPEVINFNSNEYLYYAGHNNKFWQIGLATKNPILSQSKIPIVIIPGLFSSWNKNALIYDQNADQSEWILNSFVHEYDGIIQTLKNLGYVENEDLFIFNYDWRKGLDSLAEDFNSYLNSNIFARDLGQNINILGHSLGGLIARIYAQKYGLDAVNKIITLGSPHQGVAQVYKPVEAGEIDQENSFLWLGMKIILQLQKDKIMTDKEIINQKIPIVRDLLPIYDFLKKENGDTVQILSMKIKNNSLLEYQENLPSIYSNLVTIAGKKADSLLGFKIGQRTISDQILDYYPDGRPVKNLYEIGDYIVTLKSASAGNDNKIFDLSHGELIYKSKSIKEILNSISIPYQENQIVEGYETIITPSIVFLVMSPVKMEVISDDKIYEEKNGLILIDNALSNNYQLKLTGKEKGNYRVLIGQIGENSDKWSQIDGQITNDDPTTQIQTYEINFDQKNPTPLDINFTTTINQLIVLNTEINSKNIQNAVKYLKDAEKYYAKGKFIQVKQNLESAHKEIFFAGKKINPLMKKKLLLSVNYIELIYSKYLKASGHHFFSKVSIKKINQLKKTISVFERYLFMQKFFGKDVTAKALTLKITEEKLDLAENKFKEKNYYYAEILIKSVEYLLKEIK